MFIDVILRLKKALMLQHDHQIADILGLTKTAFAERKRRNSIPEDKIKLLAERESINMDWLLTGEGNMKIQPGVSEPQGKFYINVKEFIADHNRGIIINMLEQIERIMNEGNYKKTSALHTLLAALDPKDEKDN